MIKYLQRRMGQLVLIAIGFLNTSAFATTYPNVVAAPFLAALSVVFVTGQQNVTEAVRRAVTNETKLIGIEKRKAADEIALKMAAKSLIFTGALQQHIEKLDETNQYVEKLDVSKSTLQIKLKDYKKEIDEQHAKFLVNGHILYLLKSKTTPNIIMFDCLSDASMATSNPASSTWDETLISSFMSLPTKVASNLASGSISIHDRARFACLKILANSELKIDIIKKTDQLIQDAHLILKDSVIYAENSQGDLGEVRMKQYATDRTKAYIMSHISYGNSLVDIITSSDNLERDILQKYQSTMSSGEASTAITLTVLFAGAATAQFLKNTFLPESYPSSVVYK